MGTFLIGCAFLLGVGCAERGSESPKEQGPTEATSEEARCGKTQPIDRPYEEGWVTNNVPNCPKGGLLSGTDSNDKLDGLDGEDGIRGLGAKDQLIGGLGSDFIYGGPGKDFLKGSPCTVRDPVKNKDVLYGGAGNDGLSAGKGEDVLYGGDGNDLLTDNDGQRDKLFAAKARTTIKLMRSTMWTAVARRRPNSSG